MGVPLKVRAVDKRCPIAAPTESDLLTDLPALHEEIWVVILVSFYILANVECQTSFYRMKSRFCCSLRSVPLLHKIALILLVTDCLRYKNIQTSVFAELKKRFTIYTNIGAQVLKITRMHHLTSPSTYLLT